MPLAIKILIVAYCIGFANNRPDTVIYQTCFQGDITDNLIRVSDFIIK